MNAVPHNEKVSRSRETRKGGHSFRPGCESMEDRTLLATMDFTNAAGGSWDVAANWVNAANSEDHHVPIAADDAVIPALGSSVSITHSAGSDEVQSVTSGTNLILSGGSLDVTGKLQMSSGATLSLQGGTLAGATATSGSTVDLTSSGGTLSGVSIAAGATLDGSQTPAGLVAYYNFDNGSNDVSGNGHNATLSANPPILTAAGYQDNAYQFTGANNNYITAPVNISPTAMPDLTMGGWFNASNASASQGGLLSDDNGGFDRTIDIDTRNGGVKWSAFSGYGVVSGAAVVPNQWVFVAVRYNQAAGTMSLDVNGTFTAATTHFDLNQLNTLTIGRNPSFAAWFTGKIDQVFVYNQVLTNAQLDAIQNGTYANVTGGLALDGTAKLGSANGGTSARLYFDGSQDLSGAGSVVLGASAGNGLFAQGNNGSSPATLTIDAGIAISGGSGAVSGYYSSDAVVLDGTVASTDGEHVAVNGGAGGGAPLSSNTGPFIDQGSLDLGRTEDFTLATHAGGGTGVIQTPNQSGPSAFDVPVNIADPETVYTLINSTWGVYGDTVGAVEFKATGGLDYTVNLVEGQDIRDHNNDGFNNTIGQGALGGKYVGSVSFGGGQVRLDEQEFVLPATFQSATLTDIILHGYGNYPDGDPYLAAATVASPIGNSQVNINPYVNANLRTYSNGTDYPLGGTVVSAGTGPMVVKGDLAIDGQGGLSVSTNSNFWVSGNLLGNTTNLAGFNPVGDVILDSTTATSSSPQLLEAMSQDMGDVTAGFNQNFAYGTLTVSSGDHVELVDRSDNSPGSGPEAVYVNSLVVPAGATLDLNGLNLYVLTAQVSGTITGGSITWVTKGGPLTIDQPAPGKLAVAGEQDDWTFFDRGGNTVTVTLDPGSGKAGGPVTPYLEWAQVELLDPSGNVLATTSSTTAGAILTLPNVALPADGTYTIAVKAASGHTSSVGNYVVAGYDVTPVVQPLNVNQSTTGSLPTPYSIDEWTFSAAANTQVKFSLLAESASGLAFSLTGPNGFTGFSKIAGSSGLVTLPASGTYTLTAQGTGGAVGSFAFEVIQTSQTSLSLGTPYSGTFAGSGQPQLFAVDVPAAAPLSIQLTDPTTTDHIALYAQFGTPPTRQVYGEAADGAGASQSLLIPSADAGTWYILVYAESASAGDAFTLVANATPLRVTAVTPVQYGTNSVATLTLTGAGFTNATSVALVAPDNTTVYPAGTVTFDTFTQLTATVNLAGVPQGVYSVRVTNGTSQSDTLAGAFTVTAAGQANLQTRLILPSVIGRHISSTFYVEYSNTGTVAMPAPVLLLESSVADDVPLFTLNQALVVSGFWTSAIPEGYSTTIEILASGKVPGVLGPGESVTVPVYYAGMVLPWNMNETQFKFDIRIFNTTDTDPVNWPSLQSALQPPGISNLAWSVVYGNLTAQLGNTWGGYVQLLDDEASYLGQLGEDVTDVDQLWNFAVQQADNGLSPFGPALASATDDAVAIPGTLSLDFSRSYAESIAGRDTSGPLGFGWSTPWQTTATTASDGTVTITGTGGTQRIFQPDSRTAGTFFSEPGDTGTLTADGAGGYLLTEADGTATDYNADGTLNYIQDTNGNRITAGYTDGLLTSLTASSGPSITIAYDAAGLISTVTDSQGRVTTYTYDASNQYLIAVKGYDGQTTTYAYNNPTLAAGAPVPKSYGALISITSPDGTHQYFTYDAEGRLAGTSEDNDAEPQSYAYALGEVSVTDGTGDPTHLYYNEQGLVVKRVDPLGNVTLDTYDGDFNLTSATNALGQSETFTYNAMRELTSATDYLGNTTDFTYAGPFNDMVSTTDADGNTTSYTYNSAGDLLSTTYANGTSQTSTFDPEGDATSFLNADGQPIQYAYNAAGQVTTETFSDGSKYTYTYDSLGDMVTATDATGTTTFTYDPATELLTKVAYPNGTSLTFTDNADGQRTSMVDQTGFTIDYTYDAAGRLSTLTDGSGNVIVTYTYDANGRLAQKTNGNGTFTTYAYDADGNILHLVNYGPGGTINSRFDYTYNALGLETSEATIDGTWTYTYDPDGQLIHAVFASTASGVPGQDLAYSYDAMGNRITTVINGATTAYTTNNVNEYTSVGGVNVTYDADGNLISDGTNTYTYNSLNQLIGVTGPGGTTTYTYNALGQCVASTTNGQTTQYLIDPSGLGDVVGAYGSGGTLLADYVYGLGLVGQTSGNSSLNYFDFDAIGSTVGISNSSGAYTSSYAYLPFGGLLASTNPSATPFQFVGESGVAAEASGLSDMGARSYSPGIGRFTSVDPLLFSGANTYTYATNNPTQRIDPSGDSWQAGNGNLVAALAGTVANQFFGPIANNLTELALAALTVARGLPIAPAAVLIGVGGAVTEDLVGQYVGQQLYSEVTAPATPRGAGYEPGPAGSLPPLPEGTEPYPEGSPPVLPTTPGTQEDPSPPPIPPKGAKGDGGTTGAGTSRDPNSELGPTGYGSSNFVALSGAIFPYEIDFENDPSATAPAQAVTITDQLDPNLDWSTFQLTGIGWGDTVLSIPAGSQYFEATVPMTYNGETFDVDVEAGIHAATGQVYATFTSIDPNTDLPPDVLTGFLPPEDGTGRGEGYISYTVQPRAGLATGTAITNVALVSFDQNTAIATDQVSDADASQGVDPTKQDLVTIDAAPPTSSVAALPATTTSSSFTVTWSGQDDPGGSGIAGYDVYVSDNGGPFTIWQSDTTATSSTFTGQFGDTYSFYSVATDNVGNVEATPTSAQATTQLITPLSIGSIAAVAPAMRNTPVTSVSVTLSEPAGPGGFSPAALTLTDNGGPNLITGAVSVTLHSGSTYRIDGLSGLTTAEGSYTLTVSAAGIQDADGNPGTGSLSTSWSMDTTPPTSSVNPLPQSTTSTSFEVSVTATDPTGAGGSAPSGVASIAIYVSTNSGPYSLFTTVLPSSPSSTFTGQVGDTYSFDSVATDNAGNVEATPTSVQATTQVVLPLSVESIAAVAPATRNTPVISVSVTLSAPAGPGGFGPGALTLTDNGGPNLITGAVSITLVSGSTYWISGLSGLTNAEGAYTLTVSAADIQDTGGNAGTGSLSTSWSMDTTPPTSSVNPLPQSTTSTSFEVSVTATDPTGAGGSASGIASISLFVSTNSGPFLFFTTVSPSSPSATFTGQAGSTYAFISVATDKAGNLQPTPSTAQATIAVTMPQNPPNPTPPIEPVPHPNPTPIQPVIIGEQALFQRKLNKKGKPSGKAVLTGFTFRFSNPLDPGSAGNAANYQVDTVTTRKVKKTVQRVLHPLSGFTVSYSPASDSVTLTLAGSQTFPTGGQVTVIGGPSGGVAGASGGALGGTTVFAISPRGRTIGPA